VVAECLRALMELVNENGFPGGDQQLLTDCQAIIERLALNQPVADL